MRSMSWIAVLPRVVRDTVQLRVLLAPSTVASSTASESEIEPSSSMKSSLWFARPV